MTFDDLDTWRVVYSQLVGADSKSGISFALNNDPDAWDKTESNFEKRISQRETGR